MMMLREKIGIHMKQKVKVKARIKMVAGMESGGVGGNAW